MHHTSIRCKKCYMFQEEEKQLQETVHQYIEALAEEQKVDRLLYEKRLEKCESCEALLNGVCKYCGCFVVVRAIKKKLRCPYPKEEKW